MTAPLTPREYARLSPLCHGIVTFDGEQGPCDKPAVSVIRDPEGGPWAACAYHAHRYGRGRMVPWPELVAAAVAAERERLLATRISFSEIERALRAADAPEDSMATEDDLLRYEGHAEAVRIVRDMLGLRAGAVS